MGFVFVIVLAELFAGIVVNDFDDFSVLICSTASRNFLNTGYTKICEKPLYSRSKYFTAVYGTLNTVTNIFIDNLHFAIPRYENQAKVLLLAGLVYTFEEVFCKNRKLIS